MLEYLTLFRCNDTMVDKIAAAMELARVAAYDCTKTAMARAMVAYWAVFK